MILVDTSVLSLALRRRDAARLTAAERGTVAAFLRLSERGAVLLTGAIRQEMLSGVRYPEQFARLRAVLDAYDYAATMLGDHDLAAECFNTCRAAGVAAGDVDMLICATALRQDVPVFTTDPDFDRYADLLSVRLHVPPR